MNNELIPVTFESGKKSALVEWDQKHTKLVDNLLKDNIIQAASKNLLSCHYFFSLKEKSEKRSQVSSLLDSGTGDLWSFLQRQLKAWEHYWNDWLSFHMWIVKNRWWWVMSMKCCFSTLTLFGRSRQKHSTMWPKSIFFFFNLGDTNEFIRHINDVQASVSDL